MVLTPLGGQYLCIYIYSKCRGHNRKDLQDEGDEVSKIGRVIFGLGVISFALLLAITALAMKNRLPSGGSLGISVLAFYCAGCLLVWFLSRKRASQQTVLNENSQAFFRFAAVKGKRMLIAGGIGIFLGMVIKRSSLELFVAGGVAVCFGLVLLQIKPQRASGPSQDGPTAP